MERRRQNHVPTINNLDKIPPTLFSPVIRSPKIDHNDIKYSDHLDSILSNDFKELYLSSEHKKPS